jgi:hypothetical protein
MNHIQAKRGPLLDHLDEIESRCAKGDLSLQDIFDIFGNEGHYLTIMFLILPFLQPIPLFGLSTPFGLLIAVVAVFAYLKKPPRIPRRWAAKKIPAATVLRIAEGSERVFEKLSFILKPRWLHLFSQPFTIFSVILLVVSAVLLALPLPIPFSNAFPAWVILFQALAHLEKDGAFIIVSYIQFLLCLVYFAFVALGINVGVQSLSQYLN